MHSTEYKYYKSNRTLGHWPSTSYTIFFIFFFLLDICYLTIYLFQQIIGSYTINGSTINLIDNIIYFMELFLIKILLWTIGQ